MTLISAEDALAILSDVVRDKGPEYVYPEHEKEYGNCVYVNDRGEPSCIVGHVLDRLGMLDIPLVRLNHGAGRLAAYGFTYEAARALRAAQTVQDKGHTWGASLAAAIRVA